MKRIGLLAWLLRVASVLSAWWRPRFDEKQVARHDWPVNARRVGFRMNERTRDAWRPRWLRLSRGE